MLGTFGLHSVNNGTINQTHSRPEQVSNTDRDLAVTALRVHNFVLRIIELLPGLSVIAAAARILGGMGLVTATVIKGDKDRKEGLFSGRWMGESLEIAAGQIARGALIGFIPLGGLVTLTLDFIATPENLIHEVEQENAQRDHSYDHPERAPHLEPEYHGLAAVLYLA